MDHAERAGGGDHPDQPGEHVDRRLDHRRRLDHAAVAGAVHGVVEVGVVEARQIHPRGQLEQALLHEMVDLGFQPRLRPARAGLESRAQRRGAPPPVIREGSAARTRSGVGAAGEQRRQHAGRGEQPERGEDARQQMQLDGR